MAHELEANDQMFSVKEIPWHGLGTILKKTPNIKEAIVASGLSWNVSVKKMIVPMMINDEFKSVSVPNNYAVVRDDDHTVIGVVGNRYEPYQNSEMWGFIEEFQNQSGIKLETAGSLRAGKTTWVLAKNGTNEYVSKDPVEEFFLFRNSFDGSSPISVMFTNVRVVCNNTLSMAIKGAKNIFNVRHTANASERIKDVQDALGLRTRYQTAVNAAMETLVKFPMSPIETQNFIETVIFPEPKTIKKGKKYGEFTIIEDGGTQRAQTTRINNVDTILNLVEDGKGADIVGVKGTAYGLYNALTEWADHKKTVKVMPGRIEDEVRFENAFYGTGAKFKSACFNELMKVAA